MAEGVRLYSQETWRLVMGEGGREAVAKCAPQVGASGHCMAGRPAPRGANGPCFLANAAHQHLLSCVQVVAYYIEQSKANNHAVREAACACIAELMCKASRICPSGLAGGAVLDDGGAWHQSCPSCFPSTAPLVALAAGGQAGRCAVRAPLAAGSGDVLQGRQLAGMLNKPSGSGCTCHCAPPAAMPSTLLHLPLSCP